MSRYREYLKEKVWCSVCDCIISKGQREPHLKTIKHISYLLNVKKDKD